MNENTRVWDRYMKHTRNWGKEIEMAAEIREGKGWTARDKMPLEENMWHFKIVCCYSLLYACGNSRFLRLATEQRTCKRKCFWKIIPFCESTHTLTHICIAHTRCGRKMATCMLEQPFSINHLWAKRHCWWWTYRTTSKRRCAHPLRFHGFNHDVFRTK